MDTPEKNITRALEALSPYINNPRQTVIWIEAYVALAAALLFLQFILGGWRRRSGHWSIQGGLWLCYTLSFPLITYTIGLMVSSPIKNGLYPLWATLLFWAAGCTNSVTAYALEDNKQWKRYLFELLQYYVYSGVILRLLNGTSGQKTFVQPVTIPLSLLVAVLFFTNLFRVIAGWMITNSYSSRVVADYMHKTDLRGDQGTLEGCRYLVRFYGVQLIAKVPTYRTQLGKDDIITVNTISKVSHQFGDSKKEIGLRFLRQTEKKGSDLQWEDVCLSFALSELLKRRFYGMECAEASLPETYNFFCKDLLEFHRSIRNDDYTRAFKIIEVELGFLYDFFFTKYAILADFGMIILLFMTALKLVLIFICGVFLLQGSMTIKTSRPVIEVGTTSADVTITVVIIGALCLVEVVQVILYVASDWAIVSLACSYTRSGTSYRKLISFIIVCLRRFNLSRTRFGKFLDRLNLFGYWQNKMGQSSVIEGCLHISRRDLELTYHAKYFAIAWLQKNVMDFYLSVIYPRKTFLVIPNLVKSKIVSIFKDNYMRNRPLTNGRATLNHNAAFAQFNETLLKGDNSQIVIMLMWHIATEYCNIASFNEEADQRSHPHRYVATTLSRYCAYLMSFVPDLLPGNSTDTMFVNCAVLLEAKDLLLKAKDLLRGKEPIPKDILLHVIKMVDDSHDTKYSLNINISDQASTSNNNNEDTDNIFVKGLKLGRDLENKGADHWKMLAEFWAETIIFIAPSDNAKAHMERLAQGGEFLTHIWALLNHAGILTREQNIPPQVVPQPQGPHISRRRRRPIRYVQQA